MRELAVSTGDDIIYIESQAPPDGPNNEINYHCIPVHPDQVDILIKWLKEAKEELLGN